MKKELINYDLFGQPILNPARNMADYFGVAPFSVFNTIDGEWQKRKKRWDNLIGEIGQERDGLLSGVRNGEESKSAMARMNGVSILDAVLAELMVKWFTEKGFKTLDPFAGDTVFGFVSSYLERPFTGIELRKEQADFNQARCDEYDLNAKYICDTSENMDDHIQNVSQDFIFSCPPYADLEVYSDLKEDLSNMSHEKFFILYEKILTNTFKKLRWERFAVIVTSEVRSKDGRYIGLVPKTIDIMVKAGYKFYNDIILVNSVGTLPLRCNRMMNSGRKVGRRHQNVLVFYKGNPNNISDNFSELIPKNQFYES